MNSSVVHHMVDKFKHKYIKLWWDTDKCFPIFGEEINLKEKILREKHMNKFLSELFSHLKECPIHENFIKR